MAPISLGIDIHNAYINVAAHDQQQFQNINIPWQNKSNRIDLNFFPSSRILKSKDSKNLINNTFIPYSLVWGVGEHNIDPFFLHTFPERFIFNDGICIGLQSLNHNIHFTEVFQNTFELLFKAINDQFGSNVHSIKLHMPKHFSDFLKKALKSMLIKVFNCDVNFVQPETIATNTSDDNSFPPKKYVHFFADYIQPYIYFYDSERKASQKLSFKQSLYRLDLAFLEKLKHDFIKSITPYSTSFNAYQRNHLFYAASQLRQGLIKNDSYSIFIPGLCHSSEYGLHDFDTNISRIDYSQFVQQNSSDFLKEMDHFFLKHKILPHDIHTLYIHGEGLYIPGLDSVLAHYFQKPRETIIQNAQYVAEQCLNT